MTERWTPTTADALSAANAAASTVRTLTISLLSAIAFLLVVAGGLTPEKLLLNGAVPLPLLERTELPLSAFFAIAPWIVLAIHAELLIQICLLSEKLQTLETLLHGALGSERSAVLSQLSGVSFSHWLLRDSGRLPLKLIQGLTFWVAAVLAPPIALLFCQAYFLPFQSEVTTWSIRLALLIDVAVVTSLWSSVSNRPKRARTPESATLLILDQPFRARLARSIKASRRLFAARGSIRICIVSASSLWLSFFVFTVPMEPLERATFAFYRRLGVPVQVVEGNFYLSNFGNAVVVGGGKEGWIKTISVQAPEGIEIDFWRGALFDNDWSPLRRTLVVTGTNYTTSRVKSGVLTGAVFHFGDKSKSWPVSGNPVNLEGRNFRFARFENVFPTLSNLSNADFRGAVMRQVDMRSTNFRYAKLDGATFWHADISASDFYGATLRAATLQFVVSNDTQFEFADLRRAYFYKSAIAGPNLGGAKLDWALLLRSSVTGINSLPTKVVVIYTSFHQAILSSEPSITWLYSSSGALGPDRHEDEAIAARGFCIYRGMNSGCTADLSDEVLLWIASDLTCGPTLSETYLLRRGFWRILSLDVENDGLYLGGDREASIRLKPGGAMRILNLVSQRIRPWQADCG